jgi:hypothetical protein
MKALHTGSYWEYYQGHQEEFEVNKNQLMQYKALIKEQPKLEKDLEKLYDRLDQVPVVSGKITKSSDDFPYIEEHMTVEMQDPKISDEIKKQIRIKKKRLNSVEAERTAIEQFIGGIPDSVDRQIFEMSFLDGKKQCEVADAIGYSKGRISQKIACYLKD